MTFYLLFFSSSVCFCFFPEIDDWWWHCIVIYDPDDYGDNDDDDNCNKRINTFSSLNICTDCSVLSRQSLNTKLVAGTGSCWHPRNPLDIDTRCCGGAVTVRSRLRILSKRLCCSEWNDSWWICVGCGYLRLSIIVSIMASWDGQYHGFLGWPICYLGVMGWWHIMMIAMCQSWRSNIFFSNTRTRMTSCWFYEGLWRLLCIMKVVRLHQNPPGCLNFEVQAMSASSSASLFCSMSSSSLSSKAPRTAFMSLDSLQHPRSSKYSSLMPNLC